jgi:hypothetical protein
MHWDRNKKLPWFCSSLVPSLVIPSLRAGDSGLILGVLMFVRSRRGAGSDFTLTGSRYGSVGSTLRTMHR